MDEFYYSKEFYEHFNNTSIALIPKKKATKELKDFRPINLLSSVYKIITKMLSMWLKTVLRSMISPPHGTFTTSKQILDGTHCK